MLFGFKGVKGADFKAEIEKGANDREMTQWLDAHGEQQSPDEVQSWCDEVEKATMMDNPEKRDYFIEECEKLGLDPEKTTLFAWLEADDKASHSAHGASSTQLRQRVQSNSSAVERFSALTAIPDVATPSSGVLRYRSFL